jgi:hypothetical protein
MRRCILLLAFLFALPAGTHAQGPVLPQRAGVWRAIHAPSVTALANNSPDSASGDAALLRESGARQFEQTEYQRETPRSTPMNVELYLFGDPSGAYEYYTSRLQPGDTALDIGGGSASGAQGIYVLVGNFVFHVSATDNTAADLSAQLAVAIRKRADDSPLPPIRTYMPLDGLIHGSQRYALGTVAFNAAARALGNAPVGGLASEVGFPLGAEAMFASYRANRDSGVLLVLAYPTPQLAEQHLHHLEGLLSGLPAPIERRGSLLDIVLPPASAAYAGSLRDEIRYQTQVTWNEPAENATEPPWLVVVGRIFLGTAVFCLIAIGLGIVFGGVRIVTKILFPGKVFDRPERLEIIQLGLSGKRIDTKDFY